VSCENHLASDNDRSETGSPSVRELLDNSAVSNLIDKLAGTLVDEFPESNEFCLVGIRRRGDLLAARLLTRFQVEGNREIHCGSLDITLYRDDFDSLTERPIIGKTEIPFDLDDKTVVLVDDVLFTGRTIRAALDELLELGRPARILLAVLIDRGGRELPIAADFVGVTIDVAPGANVQVLLEELDGIDSVRVHGTESQTRP
jgi:pyrimidine operon attenuation protein / uracil phosphoribosyltransferase